MTALALTTRAGKRLAVTVDRDTAGRTFYAVAGVGTFTVGLDRIGEDAGREESVSVAYGRVGSWWHDHRGPAPEAPVLFGVTLIGGAVFRAEKINDGHWWLACRRAPSGQAPDRTAQRASEIVRALVEHWQDDPDGLDWARAATARAEAPRRLRDALADCERIEAEINAARERLARARHRAAQQRALLDDQALDAAA